MQLKRLEIQGFKSFADKVVLDLPPKICAIVGPNGSGKSNIVDALRWVLGELSQKQIRIQDSTDVIFSGSPSRARNSMALVNLEFSDPENVFGLGTSQVVFQRKLARDAEGSFYINNQPARLKDIVLYLTRAKAGVHGVSIINQGAADAVLKANPQERYEMLLETLGLKELDFKKEESKRRLIESKNNLAQIHARREEIRPQLRFLKKEKEKAESKEKLRQELKQAEVDYFSNKFFWLEEQLKLVKAKVLPLSKQRQDLEKEIKLAEEKLKASQSASKVSEELIKNQDKLTQKKEVLVKELAKLEALISIQNKIPQSQISPAEFKEKLQEISSRLREVAVLEAEKLREEVNNLIIEIDEFLIEEPKVEVDDSARQIRQKEKLAQELASLNQELLKIKSQLIGQGGQTRGEGFEGIFQEYKQKQQALLKLDHETSGLNFQEQRLGEEESRVKTLFYESTFSLKKENLPKLGSFADEAGLKEKERQILNLRMRFQELGEVDSQVLAEAEKIIERYEVLTKEAEDLEQATADLKKLIKQLDDDIKTNFRKYLTEISREFNNYFRLTFSGGKASIFSKKEIIEEENNNQKEIRDHEVREVVEISVEPPGKKIKGLEMLSGGERALTSIALLFAVVKTSQPPFLILDEVDAALDESNAQKFAKILKELSNISQFIVVTHNRATMEIAESLFGVTMDKDAVSKIISLRLEEV